MGTWWHPQYVPSMGPHWCPNRGNHPDTFPFGVGPRGEGQYRFPTPYPICADKGHNRERSQGDMIGGLGKVYKGEIGVVLVRCMEGSAPREG